MSFYTKTEIRRSVRKAIATLSEGERASQSAQIVNHIASLAEVKQAEVIALFASLPDEPSTTDLIAQLSPHKRIVLPRIEGEEMEFYDISEGLSLGAFGIMEPQGSTPISPDEIDLMVVPGVAFTRNGSRCGRGKGFYDKYLSRRGFRAYTVGICYPCQIVEVLPCEEHDIAINLVISE